jgi:3-hydroxyisobutyrate dehydrogenase-like beta-hydroxyacid dehydrogenase
LAGGDPSHIESARVVMETFAAHIIHVGPTGCGHLAKLINQVAYLGYVALVCEAALVADAHGLKRADLIEVLRRSVGGHPLETHWEARLVDGDRTPGFQIARVLKDLRLGTAAFEDAACDGPIANAALSAFERAAAAGHALDDMTALAPLPEWPSA